MSNPILVEGFINVNRCRSLKNSRFSWPYDTTGVQCQPSLGTTTWALEREGAAPYIVINGRSLGESRLSLAVYKVACTSLLSGREYLTSLAKQASIFLSNNQTNTQTPYKSTIPSTTMLFVQSLLIAALTGMASAGWVIEDTRSTISVTLPKFTKTADVSNALQT